MSWIQNNNDILYQGVSLSHCVDFPAFRFAP